MNKRRYLFQIALAVLALFLQFDWFLTASVAVAQEAGPPSAAETPGSLVYLPVITSSMESNGTPTDSGSLWLPFTLGDGSILPTYGSNVAVDRQGGIHVVYAIYSGTDQNGQKPATYAYCSSSCGNKANWSFTHIGDAVQDARIALDPNGRPRLILFGPVYDPDWPRMRYQYAACNSGCSQANNWIVVTVATPIEPTATREYNNNRYFAMDRQGHPAFIYTDTVQNNHPGTFFVSCQANCTDPNQWLETTLTTSTLFDKPSLAFSPTGQPRLAFGFFDQNSDLFLSYAQCDQNCADGANWVGTTLVQIHGSAKFSLAVDSKGGPRMGVFTGSYGYDPFQSQKLLYLWCDAGCDAGQGWYFADTSLPYGSGDGVDFVLDDQDRPRMSFEMASQGLGYAWCNANCEADNAVWQSQEIESQASLADNYEVLPIHRCTVSTWFNGQRSSLALDPAGNPRIAYDAQHWWYGTEIVGGVPQPCNYQDVTVTRISIFPQP